MILQLLIALAAGAASALMFASIASGAFISVMLFWLAPLPIMVVALGWTPMHATVGGIAAATTLGLLFGIPYLGAYVLTAALPGWWLGHLATLGRPADATLPNAALLPGVEWYPPGRLLLWIAIFASMTTMAALLTLGGDVADINGLIRNFLIRALRTRTYTEEDIAKLVAIVPAIAATAAIITLTLSLWLAGKITRTSGRLKRTWPDLAATALPPMTLVALCVALAFSFVGGLFGMAATVISGALLMAYALTGLATLHAITRGRKSRVLWLSSVYALVTIFGLPVIGLVVLGLTDALFDFRRRFPPPSPTPLS